MAQQRTPHIRLRSWHDNASMTRAELADAVNTSPAGQARHLCCDEERILRWESGEVAIPSADYRKALHEFPGLYPAGQESQFLRAAAAMTPVTCC